MLTIVQPCARCVLGAQEVMWNGCLGSVWWLDDLRAGCAFTQWPAAAAVKSLQLCPTLFDPMDCSPPGSSVHGILQARILEWVAILHSGLGVGKLWDFSVFFRRKERAENGK